jgi:hypothetical protein
LGGGKWAWGGNADGRKAGKWDDWTSIQQRVWGIGGEDHEEKHSCKKNVQPPLRIFSTEQNKENVG